MSYECGIVIERITGVKYNKTLQELLGFDERLGVDVYTPIYWCSDEDLDNDIRWSLVSSPLTQEPYDYVKLTILDIDNIIRLFEYRTDKIKKKKHLLMDRDKANDLAREWQVYEFNIKRLKLIRALMRQRDFKGKDGGVYYFTSY